MNARNAALSICIQKLSTDVRTATLSARKPRFDSQLYSVMSWILSKSPASWTRRFSCAYSFGSSSGALSPKRAPIGPSGTLSVAVIILTPFALCSISRKMAAEIGGRFYMAGWGNGIQTRDVTPRSRGLTKQKRSNYPQILFASNLGSHPRKKIIEVNPIIDSTATVETKTQFLGQVPCSHAISVWPFGWLARQKPLPIGGRMDIPRTDRRSRMTSGLRDRIAARSAGILPARVLNSSGNATSSTPSLPANSWAILWMTL